MPKTRLPVKVWNPSLQQELYWLIMSFDVQAIFANLAEKEKIKGHHSPEGRAIRTLSRALSGLSSGSLSRRDVMVLCDQAMEDWLKARCKLSPWSTRSLPELIVKAVEEQWVTRIEAVRLQKLRNARNRVRDERAEVPAQEVESALLFCIELIERHW
jgi:hypothetical protein